MPDIRPSPIAGKWYPGNAVALQQALDTYLEPTPTDQPKNLLGLLAPHAGMRYSGPVAGKSFRYLRDQRFDTVVVISPSHYPYPAAVITTAHEAYQTPLGTIPVANDVLEALTRKVDLLPVRTDPEHAIEIELPFLQYLLGDFRLVPLAMMDQDYETVQKLAAGLGEILKDKQALFVASSDLSHFYDQATANKLDHVVLDAVAAYDAAEVIRVEDQRRGFACGRGAIATVMLVTKALGASAARIEHYATSGDVTHDFSSVVGYGAAVFYA